MTLPLSPVRAGQAAQGDEAAAVTKWLGGYDAAFTARDLDRLATF